MSINNQQELYDDSFIRTFSINGEAYIFHYVFKSDLTCYEVTVRNHVVLPFTIALSADRWKITSQVSDAIKAIEEKLCYGIRMNAS